MTLAEAIQKVNEEYEKLYGKGAVMTLYPGSNISFAYEEDPETQTESFVFTDADGSVYTFTSDEVNAYIEDHPEYERIAAMGAPIAVIVKLWYDIEGGVWYVQVNDNRPIDITGII